MCMAACHEYAQQQSHLWNSGLQNSAAPDFYSNMATIIEDPVQLQRNCVLAFTTKRIEEMGSNRISDTKKA